MTYSPYVYSSSPASMARRTQKPPTGYVYSGSPASTARRTGVPYPPAAAPPAAGPPPVAGTAPAPGRYDYSGDPILGLFNQGAAKSTSDAQGSLLEAQKRSLIGFGSSELAGKVLGQGDPTAAAAGANPFSTLANLGYQYGESRWSANQQQSELNANANSQLGQLGFQQGLDTNKLNQDLNDRNLWYSSTRPNELGALGQQYGYQRADITRPLQFATERTNRSLAELGRNELADKSAAASTIEQTLAGYQDTYGTTQDDLRKQRIAAEQAAYERALKMAGVTGFGNQ